MSDIFDHASDLEELHRQQALTYRKPILFPKGRCYYCLEVVEGNRIFCDSDCGSGWELEESARERNGK